MDTSDIGKLLSKFSKKELCGIYRKFNHWEWPIVLGAEPEGWDDMPNYQKPYMDECQTREDIIRPYMLQIRKMVSREELDEATWNQIH